jgi:cell division transport system permease protein
MCYLSAVALASAIGVGRWVNAWQAQANLKMSLYIPPIENDAQIKSHHRKMQQVLIILNQQKAIQSAKLISKEEMSHLLAPWIGQKIDLTYMPVMDLIDITLEAGVPLDEDALGKQIKKLLPEAALEDHQQWHVAIARWVLLVQILAGLVLLAALACMTAVISLAAHATIDANRHIVSIFHLIGAEDRFVINIFRRYFLRLGLVAGLVGAGAAALTFLLAEQLWQLFVSESLDLSAIGVALQPMDYAALVLIPTLACLIAIAASRKQALAHLKELP